MAREFESFLMRELPVSEAYDLLTATIAPRPIAFVSTINAVGTPNVAPFSFFVLGGANPPSLVFSAILNPDGSMKETLKNVLATGEFVVNTVHREMMEGVSNSAVRSDMDESKWGRSGFTQVESVVVKPPRVPESLVQFECKLFQVVSHGDGPGAARYVVGEVVVAHVSGELVVDGRIAPEMLHPIARLGTKSYVDTAALELFE